MTNHTTFPAKKIDQLRKKAANYSEVPDSCPNGWTISIVDPTQDFISDKVFGLFVKLGKFV
jgi:hypothetical protein